MVQQLVSLMHYNTYFILGRSIRLVGKHSGLSKTIIFYLVYSEALKHWFDYLLFDTRCLIIAQVVLSVVFRDCCFLLIHLNSFTTD